MKLEDTGQTSMELGFEIPQPGTSVLQFEEGITLNVNENTGKTTLKLPFVIDKVIEGPEDNAGKKLIHFVPIETQFGEKQLVSILNITGLASKFAKKFGEEVEATSDTFVDALKLKLTGQFVRGKHTVKPDNKGIDRCNIVNIEALNSNKPGPSSKPAAAAQPQPVGEQAGDDWE